MKKRILLTAMIIMVLKMLWMVKLMLIGILIKNEKYELSVDFRIYRGH